tara:strand:+ start:38 stop:547 length:510 start_codon:yes stop_codon:yes gene_type:complete
MSCTRSRYKLCRQDNTIQYIFATAINDKESFLYTDYQNLPHQSRDIISESITGVALQNYGVLSEAIDENGIAGIYVAKYNSWDNEQWNMYNYIVLNLIDEYSENDHKPDLIINSLNVYSHINTKSTQMEYIGSLLIGNQSILKTRQKVFQECIAKIQEKISKMTKSNFS